MGMQEMREELEDLSFRTLDPEAYAVVKQRLDALAERNRNLIGEIESQLSKNLQKNGITARVYGRRKQPFSIWTKMERKSVGFEQLSDIFGFRVVMPRCRGLLPRARRGAYHLAGRARPLQGLHLDAEAERLPLDPHHRDRARQPARRAADPHRGDEPDRRIRHRRARLLQGRRGLADRAAQARIQRLCLAAPHRRHPLRKRQSGRVPGAHQARAVPRPGVLLHPEGQADRAAAPGQCDRLRLCRAYRRRQSARSAARSTASSRRCRPNCRTATRSRS